MKFQKLKEKDFGGLICFLKRIQLKKEEDTVMQEEDLQEGEDELIIYKKFLRKK